MNKKNPSERAKKRWPQEREVGPYIVRMVIAKTAGTSSVWHFWARERGADLSTEWVVRSELSPESVLAALGTHQKALGYLDAITEDLVLSSRKAAFAERAVCDEMCQAMTAMRSALNAVGVDPVQIGKDSTVTLTFSDVRFLLGMIRTESAVHEGGVRT